VTRWQAVIIKQYKENRQIADEEAREIIKSVCQITNAQDLQTVEKSIRNSCLKELKEVHRLSIRQIERLTGINRGVIFKA